MCTKSEALIILNEVFAECNTVLNNRIKDAFLYGSYARGDNHAESDVDILITVDMPPAEIAQYRNALATVTSNLSLKHDITVSVTAKPHDHFMQWANVVPYYKNVINEGVRYAN